MRKIIVLSFISLDGVMQAPGGPKEDTSGGFQFGGWTAPYFDEEAGKLMEKQLQPAEYLLGRKTFQIFESYWPKHGDDWPGINEAKKYVVSHYYYASPLHDQPTWENTIIIDSVEGIKQLKNSDGPDLQVHGSSKLVHLLLMHDLVDELWLKIFPLTLGEGKKLFTPGAIPAAFTLTDSVVTSKGVIFANYKRAGEVKTGNLGD